MDKITNDQMMQALDNEEYQKIMTKAAKRFLGILSWEELDSCKKVALWRALATYDPNRKNKFTSYLYRGVFLECKAAVKFVMTMRKMENIMDENIPSTNKDANQIDLKDEILSIKHGEILEEMFIDGCTTKELASKYGVSPQMIQMRKKKALNLLKSRL